MSSARKLSRLLCAACLVLLAATVHADDACNCNAIRMAPAPVCGADGITYANACVATCQGIAIVAPTACQGAGAPTAAAATASASAFSKSIAATATVGRAVMNKHRAEGFSFVARVRPNRNARPVYPTTIRAAAADRAAAAQPAPVLRVDNAGGGLADMYALSAPVTNAPAAAGPAAASIPPRPASGQPRRSRALLQGNNIGGDDRMDTEMIAHVMPLSAVGLVDLGDGTCSGALVGPRTVLTAGHCVWSATSMKWSYPWFHPNLHGDNKTHCHAGSHPRRCYTPRRVDWETMNIMRKPIYCGDGCMLGRDIPFDIAVIILAEDVSSYGYFGFGYSCSSSAQTKFPVTTAGYPGDKLRNYLYTSVHLSDQPTVTIPMCPATRAAITSNLDVSAGQSGSPFWSPDGYVRAVHSGAGGGDSYHVPIDQAAFNFIAKYRK